MSPALLGAVQHFSFLKLIAAQLYAALSLCICILFNCLEGSAHIFSTDPHIATKGSRHDLSLIYKLETSTRATQLTCGRPGVGAQVIWLSLSLEVHNKQTYVKSWPLTGPT